MKLALAQYQIGRPASLDAFASALDARVTEAARAGGELLVLPEYACVEAAAAFTNGPDLPAEIEAVRCRADMLLRVFQDSARRHGVWLLAGSMPVLEGAATHNRAPLISPDGRVAWQDKRVMTPFEAEQWGVSAGAPPGVFETSWGRIGVCICYDVEFPNLVRAQVHAGAWLILVPTCTDTIAGFNRVRLAARARALENQCYVAVSPTVGAAPWLVSLDVNRGYAAVFGPVDHGFPEDGVLARGALDEPGWVFADLDPARLDAVRADGGTRNHHDWPSDPPPCKLIPIA